ncbi:MAG TPA: sigma-70 family RNA polymerase sigma factor, partial [Acidimicrobiia bacterium]|nr:sigma-70 family RNA polymerase sigma factor [Acidimicrobiia bacterium]
MEEGKDGPPDRAVRESATGVGMAVRIPLGGRGDHGRTTPDEIDLDEPVGFDELWAHREALHRVCERLVGDPYDADDLVQETYLKALSRMDDLDRRESFLPWLATVARHRGIDELRRRRFAVPAAEVPEAPDRRTTPDPGDAMATTETLERVREAMAKLTPRERRLLLAQVHRSLTLSELAEEDGSTVASVRSVLTRARS